MAQITVDNAHDAHGHHDVKAQNENQKLAVWLLLASEVVIFSTLIAAYILFRISNPESVKAVHQSLGVALVTANTFLLLASSYAMVMALRAIEKKNRNQFMMWMSGVVGLGIVFVIGQYIEYAELSHLEITLGGISDQFGGFGMRFYAPTAFHGAHVILGVFLGLHVMARLEGLL